MPASLIDQKDCVGARRVGVAINPSEIDGATLAATGAKALLSAPHAALANGTLIQSFELDDVHRQGVLHVGAVTLPPLIAITELRPGFSGRDFLQSAVAGYEIGPLFLRPLNVLVGLHSGHWPELARNGSVANETRTFGLIGVRGHLVRRHVPFLTHNEHPS